MSNLETQHALSFLSRFHGDIRGDFSIMAAGTILTILAGVGLAVDGAMLRKDKLELQYTVDAAALAIAKQQLTDEGEMAVIAGAYFDRQSDLGDITLNSASREGSTYTVDASKYRQTYFMHLFGKDNLEVRASGTTIYQVRDFNIAMVLDTTGSMGGDSGTPGVSKMDALKTAANVLIDGLDSVPGDVVRMSVVPFERHVNVGANNWNASFISNPFGASWTGCVGSRSAPWNMRNEHQGVDFRAVSSADCGEAILPMTNNLSSVRAKIGAMEPSGWTYIPAGLAWGWRTLTNAQPFTEVSASSSADAENIIILMTDGANTVRRIGNSHKGNEPAGSANAETQSMCTDVKTDNITIYTIAFGVTDVTTKNIMENCASATGGYFAAENAQDLSQAFAQISSSIQTLRLTN